MLAVEKGDARKLAELIKQDPGFNVNIRDGSGHTLLHHACIRDSRSPVIPLLLAHPDIDVNAKNIGGCVPFLYACSWGCASCVREMLKDSRVKVNEPEIDGCTPLWCAAYNNHLDVIKCWIASGREMDLGEPGDADRTDAIGVAKKRGNLEVVTLLERFKNDATKTRHQVRVDLSLLDELAAEMFALVVFVSDGLLKIDDTTTTTPAARFFKIVNKLPLELQMVVCFRQVGSTKEIIRHSRTWQRGFENLGGPPPVTDFHSLFHSSYCVWGSIPFLFSSP